MNGKIVAIGILACSLIAGSALYYLQVYGFYEDVSERVQDVQLVVIETGTPETIAATNITAIDADSSPIRFRACFETSISAAALAERYVPLEGVDPRNAPFWFDCFDAEAIAAALKSGEAQSFLGEKNVAFGVDRVIAITETGRGYIWHELNDCGEKAYDGTIVGEECPKRPSAGQ